MTYSITQLFELITQPKDKCEFYYEQSGNIGIDDYISQITGFRPDESRILWGDCNEDPVVGLDTDSEAIWADENEILLFSSNCHDVDFMVERMASIEAVLEFMYSKQGLQSEFLGDISIIQGHKRRIYFVKDSTGKTITWDDMFDGKIPPKEFVFKIELM